MRYRIKKATAMILSVMLMTMLLSSAVLPPAMAAGPYGINFINASDKLITTIVENAEIQAEGILPPGHAFDQEKPFLIEDKDGTPNQEYLFQIKPPSSGKTYTITALDGSAGGAPEADGTYSPVRTATPKTYTLKPKLFADITEGLGSANVKILGLSDVHSERDLGLTVKSKNTERVTSNSSVRMTVKNAETESIGPTFETLTTADVTGTFNRFDTKIPLLEKYTRTGNVRTFDVRFGDDFNVFSFTMALNPDEYIQPDTTIEIHFNLQEINPLTLTVITPRAVLENVHTSITNSPRDPKVTDGTTPYVKTVDELYSMRSTFSLLKRIKLYNDNNSTPKVSIEWAWKPTPPNVLHDGVVQIDAGSGASVSAKISPKQEDVKGLLVATPSYTLDKVWGGKSTISLADFTPAQANPQVPITALGSGSSPQLKPTYKIYPDPNTGAGVTEPMTDPTFPANMVLDVYNRNKNKTAFEVGAQLSFGKGYGRAEKVIITSTFPNILDIFVDNSALPYKFGDSIVNIDTSAGALDFKFVPRAFGKTDLTFTFIVKDSTGKLVESPQKIKTSFTIEDHTPLGYAEFSNIQLLSSEILAAGQGDADISAAYPGGKIAYGFKTETTTYDNIKLPYMVTKLNFKPFITTGKQISKTVKWRVTGLATADTSGTVVIDSTNDSFDLEGFAVNSIVTVSLTATAENGDEEMYILKMVRQPQDPDSTLKWLTVKDKNTTQLLQNFVPNQLVYNIEVPYKTRLAKFEAKTNSPWAAKPSFVPELTSDPPGGPVPEKMWAKLTHPDDKTENGKYDGPATTVQTVVVEAENGSISTYTVNITRKDPSTNNNLGSLAFKDSKGVDIPFDQEAVFDKTRKEYRISIPYSMGIIGSTSALWLDAMPEDTMAEKVKVTLPGYEKTMDYTNKGKPIRFVLDSLPEPDADLTPFDLRVTAFSEAETETDPAYVVHVTRRPPDADGVLASLELKDQDNKVITNWKFNQQTMGYQITLPFQTDQVTVIPKARSPLATVSIVIDGKTYPITVLDPSRTVDLKPEMMKEVIVLVKPEDKDAEPTKYTLELTRSKASDDARLKTLITGGGTEFAPKFTPDGYNYSVTVPEGTPSVTFTATPLNQYATMTINGEALEPGTASLPIEPLSPTTTVVIEVTAQDGKTTKKYTITLTNRNLVGKSNNADLESLRVDYGSMTPRFQPAVTTYDVAVKDDTSSVNFYPIAMDAGAKVEVLAGTKLLGDYYGNFASALVDGENAFTVRVTAEDGTTIKTYAVLVYRRDEEKQNNLKPIVPDMINYEEGNPIVVDITRYAVVSADVFNKLKQEYPEKSILFQGNDYSLQIKGKDLDRLIPHEQVFDLSLSFTTPEEDKVWQLIQYDSHNQYVDPVFIYFNHHGALPAPMLLTLSLGHNYRNESSTWNYYNTERDRIDFYGGIRTNSRGTFTVPITHFSTYIYSFDRIVGAENKTGNLGNTGSYTGGASAGKPNPNTGAE